MPAIAYYDVLLMRFSRPIGIAARSMLDVYFEYMMDNADLAFAI